MSGSEENSFLEMLSNILSDGRGSGSSVSQRVMFGLRVSRFRFSVASACRFSHAYNIECGFSSITGTL